MFAACPYVTLVAQVLAQVMEILSTKTCLGPQPMGCVHAMHKVRTNKSWELASSKHNALNPKQTCNEFEFQTQRTPPYPQYWEKAMALRAMALGAAVSCEQLVATLECMKCKLCRMCEFSHWFLWQSLVWKLWGYGGACDEVSVIETDCFTCEAL